MLALLAFIPILLCVVVMTVFNWPAKYALPAAWLLGRLGGLEAVWFAFPIAEFVSLCLSAFFLIKTVKDVNRKLSA